MKWGTTLARVLLVVLTFIFVATAADAPKLTFKFTTVKVKGAQDTRVFGTNNAGTMVGAYVDSGGVDHGFMLKGGKVTTIDDPNGTGTNCLGINTAGDVVGYYINSSWGEPGLFASRQEVYRRCVRREARARRRSISIPQETLLDTSWAQMDSLTDSFGMGRSTRNWMRRVRRRRWRGELMIRDGFRCSGSIRRA